MLSSLDTSFDRRCALPALTPRTSPPGLRMRPAAWLVLLAGTLGGAAWAGPSDALHPYASLAYNYEDNLFRLADANPGYDNTRSDTSRQAQAGLLFNQTYGRQVVSLQAKVSRVSFDHFTQLNYNGKDMLADLNWHLGARLEGNAGLSYMQVLAPYTDITTRERNLRVQKREYVNGAWGFHPSWRLRLGATHNRYTYDLLSQAYNNRSDRGLEAGVDYLASSGSSIGVQANKYSYKYDQLRQLGSGLVDAGTDQDDVKLKVDWRSTGVSSVQFLGGWSRRTHAFFTERDSSGFNALLKASTVWDGKVNFDASVWRQYGGVESNLVSYSLNTGGAVNAVWTVTPKIQASAQLKRDRRAFKGLLAASAPVDLSDATNTATLGATYVLLPSVRLNASVFREARSGLAAALFGNGNYHAKGASFNVNLQY
ncbi:MAG: XrtB/PEP-CTERM-associated polysaccharide biosynthesis outer membrane protein EpsL [Pseudomonadota bacterium]